MKIKFWEKDLVPRRLTLKGWAAINDLEKQIKSRAEEGDWSAIPNLIFQIIDLGASKKIPAASAWMGVFEIYNQVLEVNQPTKRFPILTSREKDKEMPWEYDGRSWYFWLNLFSKTYGWSPDRVASMDIDEAIGLYQEIVINDQLEKEWEWGLSEISYEYNKTTKKSHFKPLSRPDWMKGIVQKPKKVKTRKIHKDSMPAGVIINLDESQPDSVE